MREPQPYALADKAIAQLNRRALQRLKQCKRNLLLGGFDELNVVREVDALYAGMDKDCRNKYAELYRARYLEMIAFLAVRKKAERDDTIDEMAELAELAVDDLLTEPNEVTHYAYDAEVYRKRDRAVEAVNSVAGKVLKQIELDKAVKLWQRQMQQYADAVSDRAVMDAFDTAGVVQVQWNTQEDEKVCATCDGLDGEIFSITDVPPKPHYHCRCWLSPVIGLANDKNSDIINSQEQDYELFRQKQEKSARDGFRKLSEERFSQLILEVTKRGAIIQRGPDAEAHLDKQHADASTLDDILFFRTPATLTEVLEEMRHCEQNWLRMNFDKPVEYRTILNEIEAREFIFQNAQKYQVPRDELDYLQGQYAALQRQLKEYLEEHPNVQSD